MDEQSGSADTRGDSLGTDDLDTLVDMAIALEAQNEFAQAESLYRRALEAGIDGVLWNYADLLLHMRGREEQAEELYRRAIRAGQTQARNNLGALFEQKGRIE